MKSRKTAQPKRIRSLIIAAIVLAFGGIAVAQAPTEPVASGIQHSEDGGALEALMFYLFAGVTICSSVAICLSKNIVRMAVYLFGTLGSVAVLYFLLMANFVGAIQLIVYAGGTLVLLIFGVMLTSKSPWARFDTKPTELALAGIVSIALAGVLVWAIAAAAWPATQDAVTGASVATFGQSLLTTYLVPFEAVSVLLLVVMIGAAYMARQE